MRFASIFFVNDFVILVFFSLVKSFRLWKKILFFSSFKNYQFEFVSLHYSFYFSSLFCFKWSAGGSTFIAEPYYREYFAGGDGSAQGYAPSRTTIYGDTADGPSQSAYEGRYTTHSKSTSVYTKTVTAAGLTVDLPSPDSGIGDAITPRDQNNIQQVKYYNILYFRCFFSVRFFLFYQFNRTFSLVIALYIIIIITQIQYSYEIYECK